MKRITTMLVDRGDLTEAGRCGRRLDGLRMLAAYHPKAPTGVSVCAICDRIVLRGLGRWWT